MSLQIHPRTKPFFKDFLPPRVVAHITPKNIDFKWREDQTSLDPEQKNYLEKTLDARWEFMVNIKQVHGDKIIVVNHGYVKDERKIEEADAIVTDQKNIAIAVRTADCIPLFLYEPQNNVIGVVHAGWKGTQQNITAKTVALMKKLWDCEPSKILAALGPSIRSCCYEVGEEFETIFPHDIRQKDGKLYLDLVSVNKRQLFQEGVELTNIKEEGGCTCCQNEWHSFRRDKDRSGRMISFLMLKH